MLRENKVAKVVVDVAYNIHTKLGPGLLESVYQAVMEYELRKQGLRVLVKEPVAVVWEEVRIERALKRTLSSKTP